MECDATTLHELLDRWEEARERGEDITVAQLCSSNPELLEDVRRHIDALSSFNRRLEDPSDVALDEEDEGGEAIDYISRYGRLRLHARGGLGVVYAAEDQRLHRTVAVKFLRPRLLSDPVSRDLFQMEAEITGRLEHPGVVPLYGLGETEDGRLFYAMRFIGGETLDTAIGRLHEDVNTTGIDPHALEFRRLLGHFVALCKTIAYAHNRGIIHRDIKPANVMLGRYGETLVVDWGLALPVGRDGLFKLEDEQTLMPSGSSRLRISSGIVGTPAYMSPEQLSESPVLRPATDVYALGATLYKLLSGRVPVEASTLAEMRARIIRGDYEPPSKHCQSTPKALEAVCLKAMAVDPDGRYATALDLANDVERYLADEKVEAYHEPRSRRLARWARRHRRAVQVAAAATLVISVMTMIFSVWAGIAAKRQFEAREAERAAREATESALGNLLRSQATTLATALQYELERRLDVVESAAKRPELVAAVEHALIANRERTDLGIPVSDEEAADLLKDWGAVNELLEQERTNWRARKGFENATWFVILGDDAGTQIARAPLRNPETNAVVSSWGDSFERRQYFRGGSPAPPLSSRGEPIRASFVAAPHRSSNGGRPLCTFTTPIWGRPRGTEPQVIGVLGIAIEVFDLTDLGERLAASQHEDGRAPLLTVAYLNDDFFDEQRTRNGGLILQHEAFKAAAAGDARFLPLYVSDALVEKLQSVTGGSVLLDDYADPLGSVSEDYQGRWLVAAAPVIAEETQHRDPTCSRTGWWVILQRRPSTPPEAL